MRDVVNIFKEREEPQNDNILLNSPPTDMHPIWLTGFVRKWYINSCGADYFFAFTLLVLHHFSPAKMNSNWNNSNKPIFTFNSKTRPQKIQKMQIGVIRAPLAEFSFFIIEVCFWKWKNIENKILQKGSPFLDNNKVLILSFIRCNNQWNKSWEIVDYPL